MTIAPKILGFTDSHNECDRCGKTELKGTYTIETYEGSIFHLGSTCIGKMMEYSTKQTNSLIKSELKKRTEEKKQAVQQATKHISDQMDILMEQYQKENPDMGIWNYKNYGDLMEEERQIKKQIEKSFEV